MTTDEAQPDDVALFCAIEREDDARYQTILDEIMSAAEPEDRRCCHCTLVIGKHEAAFVVLRGDGEGSTIAHQSCETGLDELVEKIRIARQRGQSAAQVLFGSPIRSQRD